MPTKVVQQFKAWSYSRWRDFSSCPAYANWKHLNKPRDKAGNVITEPEGPPLVRGSRIHAEAEAYALGRSKMLSEDLQSFKGEFKDLLKAKTKGLSEKWGFTSAWAPTEWMASDIWLRQITDAWVRVSKKVLRVIDFKTGKIRGGYDEQTRLYAVGAFVMFHDIETVKTELWFSDQGEIIENAHSRDDFEKMKRNFEHAVAPMFTDTLFSPTPGPACRFCFFAKNKSGICQFDSGGNK